MSKEPNYFKIIKEFPHIIDDFHIEFKPRKDKEGNALKQFSDVVDKVIKEELQEALKRQAEWFFSRIEDQWCNAHESCGIEGDFVCSNCKKVINIKKMYQKYLGEKK